MQARANKQVRLTRQQERNLAGSGEEHTGKKHNYVTNLTFRHFMEAEGSLPYSQQPTTCPYRESSQSSLRPFVLSPFKLNFNIILPFTSGSSKRALSSGFPVKIPYAFLFYPFCATCPAHHILPYLITLIQDSGEYKS